MAASGAGIALVSDLDHTMVQNEDATHKRLLAFNHVWTAHCRAPGNVLVFSTGRSPTLFAKLWEEAPLLTPDVLICSVGTEIFYNTASPIARLLLGSKTPQPAGSGVWASFTPDPHWESVLDQGWSRSEIQALVAASCPQLTPQAASEQRPHKLSYLLPAEVKPQAEALLDGLRAELSKRGLAAKIIYSGGQDVDVLAQGAGKGCGLAFLLKRLREAGWEAKHVQVNGDSGNDSELLDVQGVVGCVVANAHPELRAYAQRLEAQGAKHVLQARNPCSGGIVETMAHFGLIPATSPVLATYRDLLHLDNGAAVQPHPADATPADAAAPAPPSGTVIEGAARTVPEDSPAIQQAAAAVSGDLGSAELGTGDTALQQLHPAPSAMSLEQGAREWAWRLGLALSQQLCHVGLEEWGQGNALPHHSPLRLLVTSGCKLEVKGPDTTASRSAAPATATRQSGDAEVDEPDAWELIDSMEARGAGDSAGGDAGSLVSRSWIDQLVVESEAPPPPPDVPDAAAQVRVAMRFKVCSFLPSGMRAPHVWEVHVVAEEPVEPVPHGFLATSVQVCGPLTAAQRRLGLPGLA